MTFQYGIWVRVMLLSTVSVPGLAIQQPRLHLCRDTASLATNGCTTLVISFIYLVQYVHSLPCRVGSFAKIAWLLIINCYSPSLDTEAKPSTIIPKIKHDFSFQFCHASLIRVWRSQDFQQKQCYC